MRIYQVRFDDGEGFASANTLEKAIDIRNANNFRFISRSLHIWEISTYGGWNEKKLI